MRCAVLPFRIASVTPVLIEAAPGPGAFLEGLNRHFCLVEQEWLEEVADDERPEGISGRERFYRITRAGRRALEREAARLESLARVARSRLALGGA